MRTIGVVTVARSDYGIYLPVLRKIQADTELGLRLMVSGQHLTPEFGLTVKAIEAHGFEIAERVEMLLASDTPEAVVKSIGLGVMGFAQIYARSRPDILLVLGDRFEMYAAALAALPFKIPVAHIHGGELTEGAIDDALRHSMTKLSHLHFVATDEYARRVRQMGEEPWRVTVSGAPSLDNLRSVKLLSVAELEAKYELRLNAPPLLVTFHPVTLEYERTEQQIEQLLAALSDTAMPVLFTQPNADTGGRLITSAISDYVKTHDSAQMVDNFGTQAYFSVMAIAAAMVGNSSSGIIEAASFKLPVVNIGTRQKGRERGANVIDVGYGREEILEAIKRACSDEFSSGLSQMTNPYGDGAAAERIVRRLKEVALTEHLLVKQFYDVQGTRALTDSAVVI
ncbi:MAG TPA: UDP-N-acetylglucosamine 2-epimerase [Pyrinomonadaceae bacterium]|nr:UDP-N-acetylglucosamine 2-epimerase [Pyrinomonadaceae bacterium]